MNQKVVFLDVDGTIVNDKGIIPESTQIAIRKAVENGHKLVVCSGRSLFQLPQMLLDLGFSGMVTAAGAQVIAGGKEIYHAVIDEEHAVSIVIHGPFRFNKYDILADTIAVSDPIKLYGLLFSPFFSTL